MLGFDDGIFLVLVVAAFDAKLGASGSWPLSGGFRNILDVEELKMPLSHKPWAQELGRC